MAAVTHRLWIGSGAPGVPRRDRRSCGYDAYLPDTISDRQIAIAGDVAADVADAESAIVRLNLEGVALADTEALARLLLRAESVASSRIEGLEVGGRRLLRAEVGLEEADRLQDVTAIEVLRNIEAMASATRAIAEGTTITLDHILGVHSSLLAGTRLQAHGGSVRTEQNWIGGSGHNPCSAVFVPPPPEFISDLLDDLVRFCNQDQLPAVVQAALAHAQFETIHPFVDGNGRTGRALIHMILRRRGLTPRVSPPVSLILATWANEYIEGLTGTRYLDSPDSDPASAGLNRWIGLFATACRRAVEDAGQFEQRIRGLQEAWRQTLRPVRSNSALDLLIRALPGAPVLTVGAAAGLVGRGFDAAAGAIDRMVHAGILVQVNVGRRNRAFEAHEVIDAFTDLERQLSSSAGNTRRSAPARRVPYRRE